MASIEKFSVEKDVETLSEKETPAKRY